MPDLLAEFEAEKAEISKRVCKICAFPAHARDALNTLIKRGEPSSVISRFFTKHGHPVSEHTVRSHRSRCV